MFGDVMERNAGRLVREAPAQTVLAVIPTLNEERHIEACIRSLMDGDERLKHVPLTVADGGRRPIRPSIATDLPEPLSPTMPRTSPGSTVMSTPSTALNGPEAVSKVTERLRRERRGMILQNRVP